MRKFLLPILLLIFSCEEPAINGCTTTTACNYNIDADKDDGGCVAPEGCNKWCEGVADTINVALELDCAEVCGGTNICGCNDTTALNYDSTATFNDGSCEFDTTSPTVVITFPVNNSTLDSTTTIKADVADNNDIISVSFLIDGTEAYADSTAPYKYEWDVCVQGTDNHTVLVKAEDSAGNLGQSDLSTFTINASYDCASVCGGDGVDADADGICDDVDDCIVQDGISQECGCNTGIASGKCDCDGNTLDCLNVCGGDALEDDCGTCDNDDTNDGTTDNCGVCDNDSTNDCVQDCAGVWGGDAIDDDNDGICDWNDGDSYTIVQIGSQFWMGENLKTTHYKNGDEIPIVYSSTEWENLFSDAYGVYPLNEDGASQLTCGDNCADVYGNLYNWYSVNDNRGICPEGFHVPSDVEFMELEMFLGMSESEANDISWRGTNEGSKLAGNEFLWNDGGLDTESEFGTSGFNALPVGYRSSNGAYRDMALISFFWSSTETSSYYALQRAIDSNSSQIRRYSNDSKSYGFSIRCIKSAP